MVHANFIKEIIPNIENNNLLVITNQIQLKDSINFFLNELSQKNEKIVFVTFNETAKNVLEKFNKNIFVIDALSNQKEEGENYIVLKSSSDLIQIQIAIKKAIQKLGEKSVIIFDSLNIISIYNSPKEIGKFIYLFSNKMKLTNNSCVFFVAENSIEEETIDFAKQFCDKTYDFSKLSTYTIQSK